MDELDITKNIRTIEKIKAEILNNVADLFSALASEHFDTEEVEILSNIIILTYILSDKLGTGYIRLDSQIINKIKLGIIENGSVAWQKELLKLSKHFNTSR